SSTVTFTPMGASLGDALEHCTARRRASQRLVRLVRRHRRAGGALRRGTQAAGGPFPPGKAGTRPAPPRARAPPPRTPAPGRARTAGNRGLGMVWHGFAPPGTTQIHGAMAVQM